MIADTQGDQVTLTFSRSEVARLAVALAEGTLGISRAEYYIRIGCSLPNIEAIVDALQAIADERSDGFQLDLVAGIECEENPRRPRGNGGTF
jgi:hypothetical protein